ncbi:UNVERIFIED_CONTAM: hypothetical protein FKN15_070354 [Acipenser sinensis]
MGASHAGKRTSEISNRFSEPRSRREIESSFYIEGVEFNMLTREHYSAAFIGLYEAEGVHSI